MLDGVGRIPVAGTGSQYGLAQPTPVATPTPQAQVAPARTEPLPSDFGAVMSQMTLEAISTLRASEQTAIQGVRGEATAQQVVEAWRAERYLPSQKGRTERPHAGKLIQPLDRLHWKCGLRHHTGERIARPMRCPFHRDGVADAEPRAIVERIDARRPGRRQNSLGIIGPVPGRVAQNSFEHTSLVRCERAARPLYDIHLNCPQSLLRQFLMILCLD